MATQRGARPGSSCVAFHAATSRRSGRRRRRTRARVPLPLRAASRKCRPTRGHQSFCCCSERSRPAGGWRRRCGASDWACISLWSLTLHRPRRQTGTMSRSARPARLWCEAKARRMAKSARMTARPRCWCWCVCDGSRHFARRLHASRADASGALTRPTRSGPVMAPGICSSGDRRAPPQAVRTPGW